MGANKRSRWMLHAPTGHLPQRTGVGGVMTDPDLSKKTKRHDSESGTIRPVCIHRGRRSCAPVQRGLNCNASGGFVMWLAEPLLP
jgi:hypothetical protein